jgi:hypothetical protein
MGIENQGMTHPTFGVIRFCHCSSGGDLRLFGSGVGHQHFIELAIDRAEVKRDFGKEYYFGRENLVTLQLSATQFAELLTTMNIMPGVPCTLRYVDRKYQGDVPEIESRLKVAHDYAKDQLVEFAQDIEKYEQQVLDLLNKDGALNKADRKLLGEILGKCLQEIKSNMPFYNRVFHEVAEAVTQHAKTEIEAFMEMKVRMLGLKELERQSAVARIGVEHE